MLRTRLYKLLYATRDTCQRDDESLLIIEEDSDMVKVFDTLLILHQRNW